MDNISQILFLVSDSLLIPDIIVLLVLFVRALFLVGSFYNQYITKYKNERQLRPILNQLTPERMQELQAALPEKDNSLYIKYLRAILARPADDTYADYMITNFENDAEKDVVTSKLLAKVGPVLGLIGTLIAMSPALTGLSQGDISKMASNMQVVFATTVVGLVVSLVGLVTLQFKQRWYAKEVNQLDYITRIRNQQNTQK
ncbi:MotA/TolQ/ExbB proton channel family protein [Capnocytophaga sp. CM59]|jgi:MotA/TolQ/ExbB proton channel domain protein|uniref:MotA/TolQ/ExbB proton channel family protein n=1 Tax=Capnocytophaga sp. CM59 TaxID=936370 RepID=UPI00027C447D|nr:MotA/TolQ/ExbB proton channel family protein [Capnocytophaga sp. CM59]EJU32445.1 transporter, MotA/TolQ/ExbB proton channel family protein [Capnocytophaga sp. CM59]